MRYVAGKVGSQTKIKIHHLVIKGMHFEENEGNSMEKIFNFSSTTRWFLSVFWSFIARVLTGKVLPNNFQHSIKKLLEFPQKEKSDP